MAINQWGNEFYRLANLILTELEKGLHNIEQIWAGSVGTIRFSTACYSFYHGMAAFVQN